MYDVEQRLNDWKFTMKKECIKAKEIRVGDYQELQGTMWYSSMESVNMGLRTLDVGGTVRIYLYSIRR